GDARHERYQAALSCVLEDEKVDGVIVILTPQAMTNIEEIAQVIVAEGKESKKPILCCFMGCFDVSRGIEILGEGNIPNYQFLESPTRVLRDMYKYKEWTHQVYSPLKKFRADKRKSARIIRNTKKDERIYLPEIESIEVLDAYEFPTLKSVLAKDVDECISAANKIGYPVAMKIVSPDIIHKFEVGGVLLKLKDDSEVKRAYLKMRNNVKKLRPNARIWGVNIQEMAKGGQEVILGAKRDSFFGPVTMFGLGGVYVETIKDISFGFIPLRPADALKIIKSIKTFKILSGIRGKPPYDISAIVDCLLRLSQLIMENESISELDINPLIVYPEGCKVADVRIILSE
ncbi:acetate--CoA ligase family protein, partial [candidate division WOR-3 bacterium]|nr:acetate--CoA ligase family protein [candidate division WOR-3 bacterium]